MPKMKDFGMTYLTNSKRQEHGTLLHFLGLRGFFIYTQVYIQNNIFNTTTLWKIKHISFKVHVSVKENNSIYI